MAKRPNHRKKPRPRSQQPRLKAGITVVTPTLAARGAMLAEAIESVKAQTIQPAVHLIAVDLHHEGPGVMLNRLVRASDTEWLSVLADDDLYDPDHLETLMGEADNADLVMSWSRIEGRDIDQYRGPFFPEALQSRYDTGMRDTFMFRRSLYDELGGWPEGLNDGWQFMCNAIAARARLVPVYRETWTYRFHGDNVSDKVQQLIDGQRPDELYHLARHL